MGSYEKFEKQLLEIAKESIPYSVEHKKGVIIG